MSNEWRALRDDRPTKLAQAVAELGRIDKTIHSLTYVDDESKRRRTLTQLNRGEDRHKLGRAVFYWKRGELRQRYREGQEDQLGALGLVVNTIVLWNTLYIDAALQQLRAEGFPCSRKMSPGCRRWYTSTSICWGGIPFQGWRRFNVRSYDHSGARPTRQRRSPESLKRVFCSIAPQYPEVCGFLFPRVDEGVVTNNPTSCRPVAHFVGLAAVKSEQHGLTAG